MKYPHPLHLAICSYILLSALAINDVFAAYLTIPQTGQTSIYNRFDDGSRKTGEAWPSPRFTNNDDGTITDNLSGLMWIRDLSCADTASFVSGAITPKWTETFKFVDQLNQQQLKIDCEGYTAKYKDWHVPNIQEVLTLLRADPPNNQSVTDWLLSPESPSSNFHNTGFINEPVWTSTSDATDDNKAWVVDLDLGSTYTVNKSSTVDYHFIFAAVRTATPQLIASSGQTRSYVYGDDGHIRSGHPLPMSRFISQADGSIIDKLTGLAWLQNVGCLSPATSWLDAISYIQTEAVATTPFGFCNNVESTHNDWRLPNLNELRSLIDFSVSHPALTQTHGFQLPLSTKFWTSTSSNLNAELNAWAIDFDTGNLLPQEPKNSNGFYSWPVRGPVDYPDISSDIIEVNFGSYFVNQEISETHDVIIRNPGTSTLNISRTDIAAVNSGTNEFTIGRDQCSNATLEHNETCLLEIKFNPTDTGLRHAKLVVNSDALGIETFDQVHIYGRGLSADEAGNSACFIATAAYGSYMEEDVRILRDFRDEYLLTHTIGRAFVSIYYEISPSIANWIEHSEVRKSMIRAILSPVVFFVNYPIILMVLLLSLLSYLIRKSWLSK